MGNCGAVVGGWDFCVGHSDLMVVACKGYCGVVVTGIHVYCYCGVVVNIWDCYVDNSCVFMDSCVTMV